jgi:hypothetical protein
MIRCPATTTAPDGERVQCQRKHHPNAAEHIFGKHVWSAPTFSVEEQADLARRLLTHQANEESAARLKRDTERAGAEALLALATACEAAAKRDESEAAKDYAEAFAVLRKAMS